MKRTIRWVGLALRMGDTSLSGVTLEELAARMDRMEKKLEAYEERYGPLESEGPLPETKRGPSPSEASASARGLRGAGIGRALGY